MQSLLQHDQRRLQDDLDTRGYAVTPLLNDTEMEALRGVYASVKPQIDETTNNGIHMTTWIADKSIKFRIRDELERVVGPACQRLFEDFRMLNTVFIVKNKHEVSDFPLHQDWSFVDETRFPALNVWIALQDTTLRNGGLCVVAGSHRLGNAIRGAGKLSFDFSAYRKTLKPYLTPVSLKAGEAVLFYYATLHGSPANGTDQPRVVVATTLVPTTAELVINYYDEATQSLEQYRVADDFTYQYENIREESVRRRPGGELLRTESPYHPPTFSPDDIRRVALPAPGLFQKILSLLS